MTSTRSRAVRLLVRSGGKIHSKIDQAERFAAAHRALRGDASIQFSLPAAPPAPKSPEWVGQVINWLNHTLEPVGRAVAWLFKQLPDAPYGQILLWTVLVVVVGGFVWMAYQRIRHGEWRWPRPRRRRLTSVVTQHNEWVPDRRPARAWLEEADTLALQGMFAEAVHRLLLRSIEDIAKHRPTLVRPSITSRELSAAEMIPDGARAVFAQLALLVERSLFGKREVTLADWSRAREAYAHFAVPQEWEA